jgi:hypothetical protein
MTKSEAQLQQMLAGVQKDIPAASSVDVNGVEWKQPDLVSKLQSWIQLHEQKDAAKASAGVALLALQGVESEVLQFTVAFRQALKQVFGMSSPLLLDFGLSTPQRKTPSVATRVLAQAKGAATRVARKTMGTQQIKKVKGAPVESVTVDGSGEPTVVSEASQPVAASPAGPAPNGGSGK